MIPHTTPGTWPNISGDRFASKIVTTTPSGCQIGLLGLADDLGVRLNRGRPGAIAGPEAFRAALARYGTHFDSMAGQSLGVRVFDAGDIRPAPGDTEQSLTRTHDRVTEAVSALCAAGLLPVCVGGGHDLTFPSVRAVAQQLGAALGGINVDPHLDVRDTVGSGMPFRALIDGGYLDPARFSEISTGRFTNSEAHVAWLTAKGAAIVPIDRVIARPSAFDDALTRATGPYSFVSIDLDVLDESLAPGVSAPNPMGLTVQAVSEMAFKAGATPSVRYFDLMELCPAHDLPHSPTARVAAHLFLMFLAGFASRGAA